MERISEVNCPLSPEEEDAADVRPEADIEAERVISHEAVVQWLRSWGTANPLLKPKVGN